MCEAGTRAWKQHPQTLRGGQEAFTTLAAWMGADRQGKQIVMTTSPGEGTQVEVNGIGEGDDPRPPQPTPSSPTWLVPKPGPGEDSKKALLASRSSFPYTRRRLTGALRISRAKKRGALWRPFWEDERRIASPQLE